MMQMRRECISCKRAERSDCDQGPKCLSCFLRRDTKESNHTRTKGATVGCGLRRNKEFAVGGVRGEAKTCRVSTPRMIRIRIT